MKKNYSLESYEKLIKEIHSLPEPNYEKDFNEKTQNEMHQRILDFSNKYNRNKRKKKIFEKLTVGFSGLAAICLIGVLAFSTHLPKNLTTPSPKTNMNNGSTTIKNKNSTSPITPKTEESNQPNQVFTEQTYSNSAEAINEVTNIQQKFGKVNPSGPPVDLGLGIKANFSGGAGQYKYEWQEGRWTILFGGWGDRTEGTKVVKNIVSYLHTYSLPIPDQKGVITITQPSSSKTPKVTQNTIAWQVKNKVYTFKQTGDAVTSLKTVIENH